MFFVRQCSSKIKYMTFGLPLLIVNKTFCQMNFKEMLFLKNMQNKVWL